MSNDPNDPNDPNAQLYFHFIQSNEARAQAHIDNLSVLRHHNARLVRYDESNVAHISIGTLELALPVGLMYTPTAAFADSFSELLTEQAILASMLAPPRPCEGRVDVATVGHVTTFKTAMSGDYDKCSICLENYVPRNKVWHLHDKHCFHKKCLQQWFKQHINTQCPLCKVDVGSLP